MFMCVLSSRGERGLQIQRDPRPPSAFTVVPGTPPTPMMKAVSAQPAFLTRGAPV